MTIMEAITTSFGAFRDAFRGHTDALKRHGKLTLRLERQVLRKAHPQDAIEAAPPIFRAAGEPWRQRYALEIICGTAGRLVKEGDAPVWREAGKLPEALATQIPGWAWVLLQRHLTEGFNELVRSTEYEHGPQLGVGLAEVQATETELEGLEAEIVARHDAGAQLDPPLDLPLPPALAQRRRAEAIRADRAAAEHSQWGRDHRKQIAQAEAEAEDLQVRRERAKAVEAAGAGGYVTDVVDTTGKVIAFEIVTAAGVTSRVGRGEV